MIMGRKLLFIIALMALGMVAKAQPVLTAADFFDQDIYYVSHHAGVTGLPTSPNSSFNLQFYLFSSPEQNPLPYLQSVPLSSVPNSENFPTATSAVKFENTPGSIRYSVFETNDLSHTLIAIGDDLGLTALNRVQFSFPFERFDVSPLGEYTSYGNITTPYGSYSNVIRLNTFTHGNTVDTDHSFFIATNPYRV